MDHCIEKNIYSLIEKKTLILLTKTIIHVFIEKYLEKSIGMKFNMTRIEYI